ncbi:hypothetical protein D922_04461 [Enterococcus faecalis 06-MB-DW-09]|nr:hypothetical protein D922_04461 [Enterococcus faecalis 06-MB-DW-09]
MPQYRDENGYTVDDDGNKTMSITPSIFVGTASAEDGEEIKILTTWGHSPMIEFKDGSQVVWSWNELINEAVQVKERSAATEEINQKEGDNKCQTTH